MISEKKIIKIISEVCKNNNHFSKTVFEYTENIRNILNSNESNKIKTKNLFEPLMASLSYQGVSDNVARGFRAKHGDLKYFQITKGINNYKKNMEA